MQAELPKPWFRIIEVRERSGLSLADIARQEADRAGVRLADMRGPCRMHNVSRARRAVYCRVRLERPDLTSSQVGRFMRKEASAIRHTWRQMEEI